MTKEELIEKEAAAFLSEKDLKDLPGDIQKDISKDYKKMYGDDYGSDKKEEPIVEPSPEEDKALQDEIQRQILEAPLLKPQVILSPEEIERVPSKLPQKPFKPLRPEHVEEPVLNTLNEFYPEIYNQAQFFEEEKPGNIDSSINIFAYLLSLGYVEAIWGVGPEYSDDNCHMITVDGYRTPVCKDNWGKTYLIQDVIKHANDHASKPPSGNPYYPPVPIISLSHPKCSCHLTCRSPGSIDEIPDNAPGIPSFADEAVIIKYKKKLFKQLKDVEVDRWSILPEDVLHIPQIQRTEEEDKKNIPFKGEVIQANPNFKEEKKKPVKKEKEPTGYATPEMLSYFRSNEASTEDEIIKEGKSKWVEDIKPIILNRQFIYKQPLGIIRPVPVTYRGFQLEKNETHSKVYLSSLGYTIEVPLEIITYINLVPSEEEHLDSGMYISLEGELAIVLIAHDYENLICYLPEIDDVVYIDQNDGYQILKIVRL